MLVARLDTRCDEQLRVAVMRGLQCHTQAQRPTCSGTSSSRRRTALSSDLPICCRTFRTTCSGLGPGSTSLAAALTPSTACSSPCTSASATSLTSLLLS